jgi:hypothetical protein
VDPNDKGIARPAEGTNNHTVEDTTGGDPTEDSRDIKGRGHMEEDMPWGIIDPIPMSHVTPGTLAGQTNAIQRSIR